MKASKKSKLYEWQLRCKSGTEKCRCGETRDLTVDHIVPKYLLEQLAVDTRYAAQEVYKIWKKTTQQK